MEDLRWHPAVLEIIAKAQGSQMHVRQAEAILNALLREGYEVRPIENDPPPIPLVVDPNLVTYLIQPGTPVPPPLRMRWTEEPLWSQRRRGDETENG